MKIFEIDSKILKDLNRKYYKFKGYNENYESILENVYFIMAFLNN